MYFLPLIFYSFLKISENGWKMMRENLLLNDNDDDGESLLKIIEESKKRCQRKLFLKVF